MAGTTPLVGIEEIGGASIAFGGWDVDETSLFTPTSRGVLALDYDGARQHLHAEIGSDFTAPELHRLAQAIEETTRSGDLVDDLVEDAGTYAWLLFTEAADLNTGTFDVYTLEPGDVAPRRVGGSEADYDAHHLRVYGNTNFLTLIGETVYFADGTVLDPEAVTPEQAGRGMRIYAAPVDGSAPQRVWREGVTAFARDACSASGEMLATFVESSASTGRAGTTGRAISVTLDAEGGVAQERVIWEAGPGGDEPREATTCGENSLILIDRPSSADSTDMAGVAYLQTPARSWLFASSSETSATFGRAALTANFAFFGEGDGYQWQYQVTLRDARVRAYGCVGHFPTGVRSQRGMVSTFVVPVDACGTDDPFVALEIARFDG